ncbi:T-complex protein 11-like protein 2 isoform X1 [Rana temporaria]|uniref:T-complex protein 11-like protein 2 isoform X1 n=2 Tax=Rana temporaria TaxID=8407 RepID=UPI001AAD181B|nr:T-complex protein 11-like protein 2 isoform X1 [Rana temporaria]XP_040200269.1 T-complex protein 11-like protein 2 isoform X1 [Rana temporaria]XP_040200270.1 T-complex protein 11-like protein 2 isoform X1 [Rana temporaria]
MPYSDEKAFGNEDHLSDLDTSRLSESMACSSSDSDSPRDSFTSDSSSKHASPVSSPPKTTMLDEMMSTTRNLSNLMLAHEIVANENFHMENVDPPKNSLERKVKEIVHKAFWDCLESELKEDPPQYEHAIKLFDEIKEILLSFLSPGTNRLRTQICEVLDVDLIKQQAEHNAVDLPKLGNYIINIMGKLCAPVRDEDVKKLKATGDIVQMLRDVFHVLDLMKMDMVNYTIQNVRPQLQRQLADYEREKFQDILEKSPDALSQTTKWIQQSLKHAAEAKSEENATKVNGTSVDNLSPTLVLNCGFAKLLDYDYNSAVPETLITDDLRILDLKYKLHQVKLVACVCLITQNVMGPSNTTAFIDHVKNISAVLLQGVSSRHFNLKEALYALGTKIFFEMNKSLTERNLPPLSSEVESVLMGQICSLTEKDHPIYNLIDKRTQEYVITFLCLPYPYKRVPVIPGGLAKVRKEMEYIGFHYANIVNFNKQVYGPFYAGIFRKLLFSEVEGGKAEAQA